MSQWGGPDGSRNPDSISFVANGSGCFGACMSTNDANFRTFKAGVAAVPEPGIFHRDGHGHT